MVVGWEIEGFNKFDQNWVWLLEQQSHLVIVIVRSLYFPFSTPLQLVFPLFRNGFYLFIYYFFYVFNPILFSFRVNCKNTLLNY